MREIVIVIADLYLPSGSTEASKAMGGAADSPGLAHIARFGRRRALEGEGGWRAWLARRLGRDDLANVPPAVIAAAVLDQRPQTRHGPLRSDSTASGPTGAPGLSASSTFWLATPLYRIAGLTTLHLDRRSLLHLVPEEADAFVIDFNRTFGEDPTSPLRLSALPGGALLLEAPATLTAATTDPARALAQGLEASMPKGPRAAPFKRLSAEVEMWLHEHPLNTFRARRGELPVNAFWFWGGGASNAAALGAQSGHPEPASTAGSPQPPSITDSPRFFGSDPYLAGLSRLTGLPLSPVPRVLPSPSSARPEPTVFVTEIGPLLQANPAWSVFDAVAALDERFIAPAVAALHAGTIEGLTVLANDLGLTVRRQDRLKFWRRSKPALTGLD